MRNYFWEISFPTFQAEQLKKSHNPPWFLTIGIGMRRPIRIWSKIQQTLFDAEENSDKNRSRRKII
jgi:hypothetical protein